jgi:hypothetical protein
VLSLRHGAPPRSPRAMTAWISSAMSCSTGRAI